MELAQAWQEWWGRVARDPFTLLLAAAATIQVTLGISTHFVVRPVWAFAAIGLFALTCGLAAFGRLRHEPVLQVAAPYVLIVVTACWRAADREAGNGLGGLVVVAVVWLGFYGTRSQVWLCIGAGMLAMLVPPAFTGTGVAGSDWTRSLLTLAVAILVGPTINTLVRRGTLATEHASEQQQIYQLLVENLPYTTVMLLDEHLRCLTIGGHWLAKTGQDGAQFRGRRIEEFFAESDRDHARAFYEQARTESMQEEFDLAGGRSYEFHAVPLPGPDGTKLVMSLARDITERRRAEQEREEMTEALAVSEESFREAFEGAPIGMALTTVQDAAPETFLRVNPAFAAILGRTPDEFVDRPVAEFTHPEDVLLQPELDRGPAKEKLRKRFLRPSGRAVWVEVSYTVVRDRDGRPSHVIKQIQDIQAMKESERALLDALEQQRAATARLRELEQIRNDLVATISHELRTPLTSVRGYLDLLGDEPLSPTQQSMLDVATRNTDRLGDLVDNLLVLSHLDAVTDSAGAMTTTDVSVASALAAAADTVRPAIAERGQTLQLVVPDDPPIVRGDADQLDRVLVNLLSNASKYTPTGGRIEAEVSMQARSVHITVSDTGIGIPEDEQVDLFKRFFRASTARANSISGNGLGLAIVKSIVERHAGEVSVTSAPGAGSTFTVTLPTVAQPASMSA